MEIKTQTVRSFGKLGEVNAQTAVECRFGGEVETVVSAHANAVLSGVELGNGEVRYFGKAVFSIVYQDVEGHVCRGEKGVEFSAKAATELALPSLTPRASVCVENVSVRREGASVYLTALLGTEIFLYGEQVFECVTEGDCICKKEQIELVCAHLCGGATETEDEFETPFLGDILFHSEAVAVTDVVCETGLVKVDGEVNLNLLALKEGGSLASFERLIPFRAEIACDESSFGCHAQVRVSVGSVSLHADADGEKGKCTVRVEIALSLDACLYEKIAIDAVTDAFSPDCQLSLDFVSGRTCGVGESARLTERISGEAALSSSIDFSDTLQAITLQRAEANLVKGEKGACAEGVAVATLLVRSADGALRAVELCLPFSVPVNAPDGCRVSAFLCGTSARQRQEGKIEAEGTVKLFLQEQTQAQFTVVCGGKAGEKIEQNDSAISVYLPTPGDGIWELAKRLKKSPEEVMESNPDLEFPIKEGQRVIVYRRKQFAVTK